MKQQEQQVLPYPETDGSRTAGWSGSDASRERARDEAANGTAAQRAATVLHLLERKGFNGMTVAELRTITGWHHGQASAALSNAHKAGRIERLAEKRRRCHVYVHPDHVGLRETQPHGRRRATEPPPEVDVAAIRAEGRLEGIRMADQETLLFIQRISNAILINAPVRSHQSGCYRIHPECALKAVANFIDRSGAMT